MNKTVELSNCIDTVIMTQKLYGEMYYDIKINDEPRSLTVRYKARNKYCYIDEKGMKFVVSENLKKRFREAENAFNTEFKNALNERDGFYLTDYDNGRYIAFKHLNTDRYHFFVSKEIDGEFIRIESIFMTAADFIYNFSFSRWGFAGSDEEISYLLKLSDSAKRAKDKFLEYEIKYMTDIATQEELDYLNDHDGFKLPVHIYLKKELYDIDDVEILTAQRTFRSFQVIIYECDIIIDGIKRNTRFINKEPYKLCVHSLHKITECKITERLANKIKEMLNL